MGESILNKPIERFRIGDVRYTTRETLGNKWALCNGDQIDPSYETLFKLKSRPDDTSNWDNITLSNINAVPASYRLKSLYDRVNDKYYTIRYVIGSSYIYVSIFETTSSKLLLSNLVVRSYAPEAYSISKLLDACFLWKTRQIAIVYSFSTSSDEPGETSLKYNVYDIESNTFSDFYDIDSTLYSDASYYLYNENNINLIAPVCGKYILIPDYTISTDSACSGYKIIDPSTNTVVFSNTGAASLTNLNGINAGISGTSIYLLVWHIAGYIEDDYTNRIYFYHKKEASDGTITQEIYVVSLAHTADSSWTAYHSAVSPVQLLYSWSDTCSSLTGGTDSYDFYDGFSILPFPEDGDAFVVCFCKMSGSGGGLTVASSQNAVFIYHKYTNHYYADSDSLNVTTIPNSYFSQLGYYGYGQPVFYKINTDSGFAYYIRRYNSTDGVEYVELVSGNAFKSYSNFLAFLHSSGAAFSYTSNILENGSTSVGIYSGQLPLSVKSILLIGSHCFSPSLPVYSEDWLNMFIKAID